MITFYITTICQTVLGLVGHHLYSKVQFQEVSNVSKNTDYIGNTFLKAYKSTSMVIVSINMQIESAATRNSELFSGFPIPLSNTQVYGSMVGQSGRICRLTITPSGTLNNEDNVETGWYNGNMCYLI